MMGGSEDLSKANPQRGPLALAALALAVVLGVMAVGIALTHAQSKRQIRDYLKARGESSAGFVSTFLSQQAAREAKAAQRLLTSRQGLSSPFRLVVTSFGSDAAVLLDGSGHLLEVAPANPSILGSRIAARYPHLKAAESGHVAVSGVVRSAAQGKPVVAIAVPFSAPEGRRVFSVAYPVAGSVLATFVEHTVAYKQHLVLLVDAAGKIITASPPASAMTFSGADPALAKAAARATRGEITVGGRPSTFVVTSVTGTPWHLVIAVPNDELFVSINGWAMWLPWIVFVVIAALASAVLVLFSRSLAAHGRLETLSSELARAAHTDALTGLANRRSLQDRLPQAWAYANRHDEPISALMIDCDDFKQINDSYGHETGDELLCAVAECMQTVFRASDIFGRWGGDEFLAVLPGTDYPGACAAGQRLSEAVEALDMSRHGPSEQMTLSVGCASVTGGSTEALIVEADRALYRAKRHDRGRGHVAATDRA